MGITTVIPRLARLEMGIAWTSVAQGRQGLADGGGAVSQGQGVSIELSISISSWRSFHRVYI